MEIADNEWSSLDPSRAEQVLFIGVHTGQPEREGGKTERKGEGGERTCDAREKKRLRECQRE